MPTRRDWLLGAAGLVLIGDSRAQGKLEQGIREKKGDVRVAGERIATGPDGQVLIVAELRVLEGLLPR